jgi:hypothetical protein
MLAPLRIVLTVHPTVEHCAEVAFCFEGPVIIGNLAFPEHAGSLMASARDHIAMIVSRCKTDTNQQDN